MTDTAHPAGFPPHYVYVSCYEAMVRRLRRRKRLRRITRFMENLGGPLLGRARLKEPEGPGHWASRFCDFPGWDAKTASQLKRLPPDFITSYSLEPDTGRWFYETLRCGTHKTIIECGCGISTAIIALATLERRAQVLSLEEDEVWLEKTRQALLALNLSFQVKLLHAPLRNVGFAGASFCAHDETVLGTTCADLLFVDAPPGTVGRMGVLPALQSHLSPAATILLDDASRAGEEECVAGWVHGGLASRVAYLVAGLGVAIMAKQ